MDPKDYERLAKLEEQVKQMNTVVTRMDAKLDTWSTNFLMRNEAIEMFRSRDQDIQETREEIKELKNDKRADAARGYSWVSIAVAILSLLVAYFK